jgi:hypothetical protein
MGEQLALKAGRIWSPPISEWVVRETASFALYLSLPHQSGEKTTEAAA